ncbi:hypothetical protein ASPZODRAFT_139641 [Penicilliopsis zonata CBS 506.65]|uniref:Major facilitator superfamily (MFS) profile domain-containing protein n=1 Tax=Penicilliopsis zonata CBS 506.65 TaxID=1073090 RepID=A0A1L9ST12_9EURO|nr:hypothetical protein ASPZODRAFT_139641 [Penicilliopsis zonata CBS 506.65]OJJ50339.1 hypothetical protein ASPZODRAFT_139641 [Penicilliopsis zonata CBS 506.65]
MTVAKKEEYPLMDLDNNIVGWESQDDPMNPRNYHPSRKWFLMLLISTITLISPFTSSVFSPAVPYAEKEFGVTSTILGTLSVTGYLFGYTTGPMFISSLSEMFGRRVILSAANVEFVAFQIGCALAPNISTLIAFRFLTGIGGSACLTTGSGVLADLFVAKQRGLAMTAYSSGILVGPVLGPVLGGYGWSTGNSGLSYLGLGVGFILGQIVFGMFSDRVVTQLEARNNGIYEPEMRLSISIFFSGFIPVSFFWYGWAVQAHTHWIVPIIGLAPFAFGMVGIYNTMQTYVIDSYPRYAASAMAALVVTRSLMGALMPLAGPEMYKSPNYGWGNSLLGFITLAMVPLPVLFHRFGGALRKKLDLRLD